MYDIVEDFKTCACYFSLCDLTQEFSGPGSNQRGSQDLIFAFWNMYFQKSCFLSIQYSPVNLLEFPFESLVLHGTAGEISLI